MRRIFRWIFRKELGEVTLLIHRLRKREENFDDLIAQRVKAEVGKWVFVGGGGGTLAAMQYCALCAKSVSKWRMVPDEGPVCEICCEAVLTVR